MRRTCRSTWCWRTRPRSRTSRCSGDSGRLWAPSWWSPTWPAAGRRRHDVTRWLRLRAYGGRSLGRLHRCRRSAACGSTRATTTTPDCAWQDRAHGDDRSGEGRASQRQRHQVLLSQGRGVGDAPVRRRPAHRQRAGSWSRPSSTPGRRPAGSRTRHPRGLRPPQRRRRGQRPAACARAPGTSSGWSRTARRWPGRPGCSTTAAVRSGGCRPRSCPVGSATPSPPGAARSWPTGRSPSRAVRRRSRSPARARRPRWPWSAPPAGSASPPRPGRSAASTAS